LKRRFVVVAVVIAIAIAVVVAVAALVVVVASLALLLFLRLQHFGILQFDKHYRCCFSVCLFVFFGVFFLLHADFSRKC